MIERYEACVLGRILRLLAQQNSKKTHLYSVNLFHRVTVAEPTRALDQLRVASALKDIRTAMVR